MARRLPTEGRAKDDKTSQACKGETPAHSPARSGLLSGQFLYCTGTGRFGMSGLAVRQSKADRPQPAKGGLEQADRTNHRLGMEHTDLSAVLAGKSGVA